MAQRVNIQERLKMRFLTVDYREKQEAFGTSTNAADTGSIALDILNISDSVLEELLELTEPMMQLVDFLNTNRNPASSTLAMMLTASRNVFSASAPSIIRSKMTLCTRLRGRNTTHKTIRIAGLFAANT